MATESEPPAPSAPPDRVLEGLTVLVVDDEEEDARELLDALPGEWGRPW